MDDELTRAWEGFAPLFAAGREGVAPGRMMSAPALCVGGRVFAFASRRCGGLGARVGKGADLAPLDLQDARPLAPVRSRAPMRGWVVAGLADRAAWEALAEMARRALVQELRSC